jgi:hypothetical protein
MSVPGLRAFLVPLAHSPLAEWALPYASSVARAAGARPSIVRVAEAYTVPDETTGCSKRRLASGMI